MADRERGSVLMLMPAAVLIFLVLGALCVDYGAVYVAERDLADAAAGAANDAASRSIDLERFYRTGEVVLDEGRAEAVARASIAAKGLDHLAPLVEDVSVEGATVSVTVVGRASHLFAKALPGGRDHVEVRSTSTVEAEVLTD